MKERQRARLGLLFSRQLRIPEENVCCTASGITCALSGAQAGGENVVVGGGHAVGAIVSAARVADVSDARRTASGRLSGIKEDMGPCLDESESRVGHLATLATPPVLSDMRLKDLG